MLEALLMGGVRTIPPGKIKKFVTGGYSVAALSETGAVWVIGDSNFSGTGSAVTTWTNLANGIADIWAGPSQLMLLTKEGKYLFLGQNLLFPGSSSILSLTDVSQYLTYPSGLIVGSVSLSPRQISFVFTTGQYASLGTNNSGGLGIGTTSAVRQLTMRTNFTDVVKILGEYSSYDTTYLLRKDGSVWGSGRNSNGQLLGTSDTTTWKQLRSSGAVDIASGARGWICVVKGDSKYTLYSAGDNATGQLGAGTLSNVTALTAVAETPLESGVPQVYFGLQSSRYKEEKSNVVKYTGTASGQIQGGGPTFTSARNTFTEMPSATLWGDYKTTLSAWVAAYVLINGQLLGVGANGKEGLLPGLTSTNNYVFTKLDTEVIK